MAIPWLAMLKSVPWVEVISNAPRVAEGAKRLWNAVANKPARPLPRQDASATRPDEAGTGDALEARVAGLESAVADLHGQMLASSELIQALADQNAQLIRRIETHRVRVLWLAAALAAVAAVAIAALAA